MWFNIFSQQNFLGLWVLDLQENALFFSSFYLNSQGLTMLDRSSVVSTLFLQSCWTLPYRWAVLKFLSKGLSGLSADSCEIVIQPDPFDEKPVEFGGDDECFGLLLAHIVDNVHRSDVLCCL